MKKYFEKLDNETREYFNILSPEIPEFLEEYINTPEMQRLAQISQNCGTDYTKLYNHRKFYNILDHSVGCALIVWNFTKDRKQTLSALFHDIATPSFKHCIDFLDGDYETQESTEDLTTEIIKNSTEIMNLLKRDNIKLEEVNDYHIYPIADNDSPRLSSDRLEYTLENGLKCNYGNIRFDLDYIKKVYENIKVLKNQENIEEIGFENKEIAEDFVIKASSFWYAWRDNKCKLTMQFFADSVKKMGEENLLKRSDLYKYTEREIIDKIEKCGYKSISECFKKFEKTTIFYESDIKPTEDKYCISLHNVKRRYINPLVYDNGKIERIYDISENTKKVIDEFLKYKSKEYAYFDFNF